MDINELNELTVVRLKELCIANGIRGASKLNKPDLIKILNEFYKTTSKQKLKAKKSPTIRRKSIDSNISPSIRSSSKSSVKSPKKSKFLEQYVNTCKAGKIKTLDTNICVPMDGPKGRKAVEKLQKSCDKKGGVFNNKTLNCHDSGNDMMSVTSSKRASPKTSEKSCKPGKIKSLDTKICVPIDGPKGRKAVEKLQKSPVLRKKTKKSRKMRENEFIEKHVSTCNPGKIKTLDTNICVPMDGPKGRKAVEKLQKSCDKKGGVFNNKTLNCHASDLVSDVASDISSEASTISIVPKSKKALSRGSPVSSEASTISIVPKSKKTLPRGSPVQSIISSTITKPCEPGKIRTLDKGNRCVSVNLKRGKETISKLQELCSNKGEGYIFNDTTYKCDKVSKPDTSLMLSSETMPSKIPSLIEIPKPLVSDKFVWSPSYSERTVTPILRSPFEQVLRSPFETTMQFTSRIPSPSSSISTIIYPNESKLEQFNRNKRSLIGLIVYEDVDRMEIIGIDENGIETDYILNRDDIVISDELENMENLFILIYHLSREVERRFPESKVIKILPPTLRILELQNNMMIDLTIPNDIRNVEKLKFVNFYVFEVMTQRIAITQKTKLEYINLIKQSETDLEEYGYYIIT